MNILHEFLLILEGIFHKHAPEVVAAATTAAVVSAEVAAQSDPKVQALVSAYTAIQAANVALKQVEAPGEKIG